MLYLISCNAIFWMLDDPWWGWRGGKAERFIEDSREAIFRDRGGGVVVVVQNSLSEIATKQYLGCLVSLDFDTLF